jgi:hypothetical protein
MRPVKGFERPILQWIFVALGAVLVVVAAGEALALRRVHADVEALRAADLNARVERGQLELRLTRERAARESFSLEAARRGSGQGSDLREPTLTLSALTLRRATPAEVTVLAPDPEQSVVLRLVLPGGRVEPGKRYAVALRGWSGGGVLWSRSDLRASAIDGKPAVTARMTGDILAPGAYEFALTDVTTTDAPADVAFYEVTIGERVS